MKPEIFGEILESELKMSKIFADGNTPYFRLSEEILEMASAYRKDGLSFIDSGDLVNAHASFAYGFGWLDFGILSGLIGAADNADRNLSGFTERLPVFEENIPKHLFDHLYEKTNRYQKMLEEAVSSVKTAPDIESPLFKFTDAILSDAEKFLESGKVYLYNEKYACALAHFSYGYGILDGAVRSGLFIITDNRNLFTV